MAGLGPWTWRSVGTDSHVLGSEGGARCPAPQAGLPLTFPSGPSWVGDTREITGLQASGMPLNAAHSH